MRPWLLLLLLWLGGVAVAAPDGAADDPVLSVPVPESIAGIPPGAPPPPDQVEALAYQIGKGLRCPVCQGLSVADSSASTAVLIQNRIREMVAAGYDKDAIETYFVSKYGEWVLLSPTSDGLNRIVWIGPALAFVLGLMAATTFLRRGAESLEEAAAAPSPLPDDPYAAELLAEVDDE